MADQESELNALLKKQSDAIRAQQQSFLQTWADAFCDRDGAAIDSLCMDGARKKMMKEQLLVIDEGDTIFGWSSPWPMWDTSDENSKGYTITTSYDGKNTAENDIKEASAKKDKIKKNIVKENKDSNKNKRDIIINEDKKQQMLQRCEAQLAMLEAELKALELEMNDPLVQGDLQKSEEIAKAYEEKQAEIDKKYKEWDHLMQ